MFKSDCSCYVSPECFLEFVPLPHFQSVSTRKYSKSHKCLLASHKKQINLETTAEKWPQKKIFIFFRKGRFEIFSFKQQKKLLFWTWRECMHYRFASIIITAGGLCMHVNKYITSCHVWKWKKKTLISNSSQQHGIWKRTWSKNSGIKCYQNNKLYWGIAMFNFRADWLKTWI